MFLIKLPSKIKVYVYRYKNYYVVKFLNKIGSIKKKFNSKYFKITHSGEHLIIEKTYTTQKFSLAKLQKLQSIVHVSTLIIKQTITNMFKIFKDRFVLEGIGFKVWKKKKILKFKLGFSAPIFLKIPDGIKVSLYKQKKLSISSLNIHCMRIFGQKLKTLKPIDVYKRKGVRVWGSHFKLKIGKKTR